MHHYKSYISSLSLSSLSVLVPVCSTVDAMQHCMMLFNTCRLQYSNVECHLPYIIYKMSTTSLQYKYVYR